MNIILIHATDEYTREMIKSALINHLALIITEDRAQCLEALSQKAKINTAFIGMASEDGEPDFELFEEISRLNPELNVIAVGDHDTEDAAADAVRHGAAGYMVVPADANAILTLARGKPAR
jgi:DNA-binding NtrC family response regulator